MAAIVCIRVDFDRKFIPLNLERYHSVHVMPEPEYPVGRRGLVMASAWKQLSAGADGMLCLDGDVVIDPIDHAAMFAAIDKESTAVHVAPVKLWPISTHLDGWVWGHGQDGRFTTKDPARPDIFTFCYTYLPRQLIEACIKSGMEEWYYPGVDKQVSRVCHETGVSIRVVWGAQPKHCNF